MARILTIEYRSNVGIQYRVEIHDRTITTPSSDEAVIAKRVSWRYDGATKDLYQKVKTRSVSLGVDVISGSPVEAFVNQLIIETDERRFWMQLYRDGVEDFRGWLQIDQSSIPITHRSGYEFTLRATDGLGLLGNYDYVDPDDSDTAYEGADSIRDHLLKILKSARLHELYALNEEFLVVSTAYHNEAMPNATDDYSTRILIDHRSFASQIEEEFKEVQFLSPGTSISSTIKEPGNAFEALESLCFQFNAFMFHAKGRYYFISRSRILDGGPIPVWRYAHDGTLIANYTEQESVSVGSLKVNDTGYYQYGGTYNYLTPLKELIIIHNKGGGNNKVVGSEWTIESHEERCFDVINNQGNAHFIGRFPINVVIRSHSFTNDNEAQFRMIFGLKIKIGGYYLVREIDSDLNVFGNGNTDPHPGYEITYEDPVWQAAEGYYKIVIDRQVWIPVGGTTPVFRSIEDIISPPILERGQLCIDFELLQENNEYLIRKYDTFLLPFDNRWDGVNFQDDRTFERSGKVWDLYWELKESYLNIVSDDGELNEDTLAFTKFRAKVNDNNSVRIEYETPIGDDAGSNTHGRLQIDRSPGTDGSDIIDADGGWSINGSPTVHDHQVKLLAWDMARMRVGVTRVMRCELKSTDKHLMPHTAIAYDGKVSIMGNVNADTADETFQGEYFSIDDIDSSKITLTDKKFTKASRRDDAGNINIVDVGASPGSHILPVSGITTDTIDVPSTMQLPNPDVFSAPEINAMFSKSLRNTSILKYQNTISSPNHFSIDYANGKITLQRQARASDEFLFVWELP